MLAETALPAGSPTDFLDRAVSFTNETLAGTLNATVIVKPANKRDPSMARAVDRALTNLRYGTVSVNAWAALGYGLSTLPWGAFPGNAPHEIGSGVGVVHNALMFDRPQKSVISTLQPVDQASVVSLASNGSSPCATVGSVRGVALANGAPWDRRPSAPRVADPSSAAPSYSRSILRFSGIKCTLGEARSLLHSRILSDDG